MRLHLIIYIIHKVYLKDIPIVFIKNEKDIFLPGHHVELECDIPPEATAVSWYQGSRILGTSKLNQNSRLNPKDFTPWDLQLTIQREDLIDYNPKAHFDALYSESDRPSRRGRDRQSRSIMETQSIIPNTVNKSIKSMASFHETGDFEFNRNLLIIPAVNENHEGNIVCIAKFDRYRAVSSEPFKLQIARMAELSPPGKLQVITHVNSTAVLTCTAPVSIPEAKITWFKWKKGERHPLRSDRYFVGEQLYILSTEESDGGHYTCRAENSVIGKARNLPFNIELKVLNDALSNSHTTEHVQYSVKTDKQVILPGCGSGCMWKYDETLDELNLDRRKDALLLRPNPSNQEEIKVVCYNVRLNNTITYFVQPKYAPFFVGNNSKSLTMNSDSTTTLHCPPYRAYPAATVVWKHNGKEISAVTENLRVKNSELIISSPGRYMRGYYQCYIANSEGVTYGLVNVNVKTRNKKSSKKPSDSIRPKFRDAKCYALNDQEYQIQFEWKTKQISLDGFIYRVQFEDTKAQSNPLYSPPIIEEEYFVSGKVRSAKRKVKNPGEYQVSLRSQDPLGFSKEETAYVQCRQRPKKINLRPGASCISKKKFTYRIPELTNLTSSFLHLQTEKDVILFEWDVKSHFKDPSIDDKFEIEVKTTQNGMVMWNDRLKRTLRVNETFNHREHFSYPYSVDEFDENWFSFRVRRVWNKDCYRKKFSRWRYSEKYSVYLMRQTFPPIIAHIQQSGPSSVSIDVTSNIGPLELKVCWKPEYYGEAVLKAFRCHYGLTHLRVEDIRVQIENLSHNLWLFTIEDGKGHRVTLSQLLNNGFRKDDYLARVANYHIDAKEDLAGDEKTIPCDDSINSLSFMQGSVIGILIVFILLCIAIIVVLMRKRRKDSDQDKDDQPPQYSREDQELFKKSKENEKSSAISKTAEYPTNVIFPNPNEKYLAVIDERNKINNFSHASSTSSLSLHSSEERNSHSTLPHVENT